MHNSPHAAKSPLASNLPHAAKSPLASNLPHAAKSPLAPLRKRSDFKHVYSRGKSVADSLLVVYACANNLEFNRLGLSVSKKVGCAVVRNRIRRWIKESCRTGQALSAGFDFIIIARASTGNLPKEGAYAKVSTSLSGLFERLGVL